jgi:hypothetical protein
LALQILLLKTGPKTQERDEAGHSTTANVMTNQTGISPNLYIFREKIE